MLISQEMYEIGILFLCHMDGMLSRLYEIKTLFMSYGGIIRHPYEIGIL